MATAIRPVIYKTQETSGYLNTLKDDIKSKMGKDADLILDYPVVYIHTWQSKSTMNWVDDLTHNRRVNTITLDKRSKDAINLA